LEVDRSAGPPPNCGEFANAWPTELGFVRPELPQNAVYDATLAKVLQWKDMAAPLAAEQGVPLGWVLATMYAEGGGNPTAELHEPSGAVGVGLMALTADPAGFPAKFGITFEEAHQPEPNLRAGIAFMKKTIDLAPVHDIVELASCYNAGFIAGKGPYDSLRSPWGLREFCGREEPWHCCHIERNVRALNTVLPLLHAAPAPPPGPVLAKVGGASFGAALVAMCAGVWAGWEAWRRWWAKR
jgi:transglycosylase-like protein with SLT domain